ncbi:MAG: zeta toxin family protein [Peptococcaceae bacterium]|nr:zeta toxin family protein [Peptococcaceae bacterium]
MYKVIVSGRGGSGKSTLVALLAGELSNRERVLVVDTDESNLGLGKMLGLEPHYKYVYMNVYAGLVENPKAGWLALPS